MFPDVSRIGAPCSSSSLLNVSTYCNLWPWLSVLWAGSNEILKMPLSVLSSQCSVESSALDLPLAEVGLSRFQGEDLGSLAGAILILVFAGGGLSFEKGFSVVLRLPDVEEEFALAFGRSTTVDGSF